VIKEPARPGTRKMIIPHLKKHILKNRILVLQEAKIMHNLMLLFVKIGKTRAKWTLDEISQLKSYMKHLALFLIVIIILALPFGLLLLPLYTELRDRREK
jgi:hypothetical protein